MNNTKINVRVEFDLTPIRHIAIQCPECKNWFYSEDISKLNINYEHQLYNMNCSCPKCKNYFEGNAVVKECNNSEEVYEGVLKKKIKWE